MADIRTESVEFAANEADEPILGLLRRLLEEQRVGTPFDSAVQHFTDALGTEDEVFERARAALSDLAPD